MKGLWKILNPQSRLPSSWMDSYDETSVEWLYLEKEEEDVGSTRTLISYLISWGVSLFMTFGPVLFIFLHTFFTLLDNPYPYFYLSYNIQELLWCPHFHGLVINFL